MGLAATIIFTQPWCDGNPVTDDKYQIIAYDRNNTPQFIVPGNSVHVPDLDTDISYTFEVKTLSDTVEGDMDGNGKVGLEDAIKIMKVLTGGH